MSGVKRKTEICNSSLVLLNPLVSYKRACASSGKETLKFGEQQLLLLLLELAISQFHLWRFLLLIGLDRTASQQQ